jgi:hypothetical protein
LEEEEQVVVGFSEISVGAGEDTGGFHSRWMALVWEGASFGRSGWVMVEDIFETHILKTGNVWYKSL